MPKKKNNSEKVVIHTKAGDALFHFVKSPSVKRRKPWSCEDCWFFNHHLFNFPCGFYKPKFDACKEGKEGYFKLDMTNKELSDLTSAVADILNNEAAILTAAITQGVKR